MAKTSQDLHECALLEAVELGRCYAPERIENWIQQFTPEERLVYNQNLFNRAKRERRLRSNYDVISAATRIEICRRMTMDTYNLFWLMERDGASNQSTATEELQKVIQLGNPRKILATRALMIRVRHMLNGNPFLGSKSTKPY
jgi:hypothetical protein